MNQHKDASQAPVHSGEIIAIITICFGLFILASLQAVALGFPAGGAFNDHVLLSMAYTECVLATVALVVLRIRGYTLASLWPVPDLRGSGIGILLLAASYLGLSIVYPLLPVNSMVEQPIATIVSQSHPSFIGILLISIINGWYEETFLLAYLVRGLDRLGASTAIGISALVRLMYHLYQGPVGAVSVLVFGIIISTYYWRSRNLWPAVFAHMLADFVAFLPQI
ncbi:CPBP family intramembrane glutamic endopeptidase [Undibacterium sp. TJN19]|uniref:CPBP family intramembrane glutamic endopeptidase n=1 Tax=Undibacterium sp. TJN19 TaxID=3413055 RepID=UPI003BF1E605